MNSGSELPNLDKIFRDEDEPDFLPSGGSSLAAIFGLQVKSSDSHSLTKQQVIKKPGSTRNLQQIAPNKTEVIIAKAVHAFKLQNGAYVSVGKLGMALTGNIATKVYQIILYKSKQDHVSTVTVTPNFIYIVQPNNYSSYYDYNKENWSILFENNVVCMEFAKEIGLARYFSNDGRIENVFYQDLSPINKDTIAKKGDSVNIKYFIASEITQPFKCNSTLLQTMTIEISTDDNWEKILLGNSKGLKRILFLPPSKQISLGPGFPKEKDVVLEIEIMNIQSKEEVTQLCKVASDKASIISRMAKMGQSMLPKIPTSTTTDSEDTEDDIPHKTPPRQRKVESSEGGFQKKLLSQESEEETPRNVHRIPKSKDDVPVTNVACKPFVAASTFTPQWSPTQIQPNFVTLDGQVYSLQPQSVTPAISSIVDPGLNMLLSETRMTNTELRMGMSKIADNVQKLLDKFHVLELQNATSPIKDQTTLDAALRMLLITTASQTEEKDKQLQKSSDVVITKSSTELNEIKRKISLLEEELKKSEEALIASVECTKNLGSQKEAFAQMNECLSKNIQELELSLKETNHEHNKTRNVLKQFKELNAKYAEDRVALESKITKLVEQCNSLTSVGSMEEKNNDNKNKEIKHIMNKIYHTLMDKFVDESYPTTYIKSTIANVMKNATLQVLYTTDEKNDKGEAVVIRSIETDTLKTSSIETENSVSIIFTAQSSKHSDVSENINTSSILSQDEPPPIPPMDTEDENDWLH